MYNYMYYTYVTSVRYVARINHEARRRAAPEGRVIYSGNVPNCGRDLNNLCRHEPVAMLNGAKFLVLSIIKNGLNRFLITLIGS